MKTNWRKFMSSPRFQSRIELVLVLSIVVLIGFLGTRFHYRRDFTRTKLYSLSDQTQKILKALPGNVDAYYFYKENPYDAEVDLLREYAKKSSKFRLHIHDLDKAPEIAKPLHVNDYGTLVLVYGDRQKRASFPEEKDITNAILRLTKDEQKKLYLTFGNGEHSMRDHERNGFSQLAELLERENYQIDSVALATTAKIPDDCGVLVTNGLRRSWTSHERGLVEDYVERGGRVLINLDEKLSGPDSLFAQWGIALESASIVDLTANLFGVSPGITTLVNYEDHDITRDFRLMTAFELPRPIRILKNRSREFEPAEFLRSSDRSWADRNPAAKELSFDEKTDLKGPLSFGVALESRKKKSRIVVIGDSEYASNAYEGFSGNADLYLNTLAWLTNQEDLISIRSKELNYQKLSLTQNQAFLLFGLAIFAIPFLVAAAGVVVWVRRRKG